MNNNPQEMAFFFRPWSYEANMLIQQMNTMRFALFLKLGCGGPIEQICLGSVSVDVNTGG